MYSNVPFYFSCVWQGFKTIIFFFYSSKISFEKSTYSKNQDFKKLFQIGIQLYSTVSRKRRKIVAAITFNYN